MWQRLNVSRMQAYILFKYTFIDKNFSCLGVSAGGLMGGW